MRIQLRILGVFLFALAILAVGIARAQERFSNLAGTVVDQTGAVLPGVTVTVTNNETQRSTVAVTNADGAYSVRGLEPGRYTVRFDLSGFGGQEARDVILLLGATADVNATMRVGGVQETVQVLAEIPLIDIGATTRQRNIPAEEFEAMPKGRSFQNLAAALPSVNTGELEGGFQVNGASAGENNFTVDGVPVVSLVNGGQRQEAVFEYLQEVQVKTSGLEAEYGGAMGGVISAVTKSGGNTFKGSLFEHYAGSGLRSFNGLAERLVIDPATQNTAYFVQDDDQTYSRNEFGGVLGGPIAKDRLFFFGSASPRFEKLTRNYAINNGLENASVDRDRKTLSAFGKVTYVPTNRLQMNLSGLWTPDKATGSTVAYDGAAANSSTSSAAGLVARNNLGYEIPQWNMSYTADYTLNDTTLISLRGGYMKDNYFDTGVDRSQTYEYATSAVGLAGVPAAFAQPAGYSNLPRTRINDHDITTRNFVDLSLTKMVTGAGYHQFKGGFGYSRATNDVDLAYPNNGYVTLFWNSSYTSDATGKTDRGTYGYYTIDDFGTKGKTGANILSLFVQDQWTVTSRLTLNLGIRTENEDIPSFRPDIRRRRHPLRVGAEDCPQTRRLLQRLRRRQAQDLRRLRPVLRLDEVRTGAGHLRRRHLDDPLPLARRSRSNETK